MKLKKYFLRLIFIPNIVLAALLLLTYLVTLLDPSIAGRLSFLGLFYPILLALNIAFIFLWMALKPKFMWCSIIVLLLGLGHIKEHFAINKTQKKIDGIKIMTFNSSAFRSWNKKTGHLARDENIDQFAGQVKHEDADVVFVQEGLAVSRDKLMEKLEFPYKCVIQECRLSVHSKYPIGDCSFYSIKFAANGILTSKLYLPNDTIQLINVHLTSNRINDKALNQLKGDKLDDKKTWKVLKSSLGNYTRAAELRIKDYQIIDSLVRNSTHRSIIAGDFNEVAMSKLYRTIRKTHKDAFVEAGNGFSATYKNLMNTLRIDYIFVDPSMDVTYYDVIKPSFSDHFPVIAHISLASQADNK